MKKFLMIMVLACGALSAHIGTGREWYSDRH